MWLQNVRYQSRCHGSIKLYHFSTITNSITTKLIFNTLHCSVLFCDRVRDVSGFTHHLHTIFLQIIFKCTINMQLRVTVINETYFYLCCFNICYNRMMCMQSLPETEKSSESIFDFLQKKKNGQMTTKELYYRENCECTCSCVDEEAIFFYISLL